MDTDLDKIMKYVNNYRDLENDIKLYENFAPEPDMITIRTLMERADLAISLDHSNDLHIIKNRYGNTEALDKREASKLISKIVANTILDQKQTLKFFKGSLEREVLEACEKIFQKWGYRNKKYPPDEIPQCF